MLSEFFTDSDDASDNGFLKYIPVFHCPSCLNKRAKACESSHLNLEQHLLVFSGHQTLASASHTRILKGFLEKMIDTSMIRYEQGRLR